MSGCVLFHSLTSWAIPALGLPQSHIVSVTFPLSEAPEFAAQVDAEAFVGPAAAGVELEDPQPTRAAVTNNASPGATSRRSRSTAIVPPVIRCLLSKSSTQMISL